MSKRLAISLPAELDELLRETAWQQRTTPSKVIEAALMIVLNEQKGESNNG